MNVNNYELKGRIENDVTLVFDGSELADIIKAVQNGSLNSAYIKNFLVDYDSYSTGNVYYIEYRNKYGNIVRYNHKNSNGSYSNTFELVIPYNHADKFTYVFSGVYFDDLFPDCDINNPYIRFTFYAGYVFSFTNDGKYEPIPPEKQKVEPVPDFKVGGNVTLYINMDTNPPVINNVTYSRQEEQGRYVLGINATHATSYIVDIYKTDSNGIESLSKTLEVKNNTVYIDYSLLQTGTNKINITANNFGDISNVVTKTFNHYVPKVSNIEVTNDNGLIDDISTISWQSTNQETAQVFVNNVLIANVGQGKNCIANKGTFKVGKNTVRVTVYSTNVNTLDGLACSEYDEKTVTMNRIMPTVEQPLLSDTNTDNKITVSWAATNQSYAILYDGTKQVGIVNDSTPQMTLPEGTLSPLTKKLLLRIFYNSGFDTVYTDIEFETTLTQNTPIIYNLEPSSLAIDIDSVVNVTFATNEFCDRWELTANSMVVKGTSDRKVTFGKNTFTKGTNTLKLIIYYSPSYNKNIVRTATKIVTFFGYGQPYAPKLDDNIVYTQARPTITWDSEDQKIYQVIVTKDDTEIINTGDVITNESNFTFTIDLDDNSTYVFKARYKNKYKWSEWSSKTFSTEFRTIIMPDFSLVEIDGGVSITISGYQDAKFKNVSVLRKTEYDNDWLEIAYNCNNDDSITDYTCPANTQLSYRLKVYDTDGGYSLSDIKSAQIKLLNYHFTNLENYKETYRLDFVHPSFTVHNDTVAKIYAGQSKPRVYKGKTNYKTGSFSAELPNREAIRFIDFIQNSNDYGIFCYRDWKGEKLYVQIDITEISPINAFVQSVSFDMIEINYVETKMYKGSGFRKIVYLNGEYKLDGSIDLSGYDDSIIR